MAVEVGVRTSGTVRWRRDPGAAVRPPGQAPGTGGVRLAGCRAGPDGGSQAVGDRSATFAPMPGRSAREEVQATGEVQLAVGFRAGGKQDGTLSLPPRERAGGGVP